ncbi:MAG: glycoside hydrolase family 32 protein, partial [Clostridiales bacterium]|nr:glycoside hydrolase family 32 protein [Clostridiales bacterium]
MKTVRKKWVVLLIAVLMAVSATLFACSKNKTPSDTLDYGDPDLTDTDLEEAAQYRAHFKSDKFVGDVMPYYENGVYSFFYLAEGGNHPVYRADTTDFVHYEDKGEVFGTVDPVYSMIGTGSVVKANGTYYLFYTGHPAQADEKIMVATSETLDGFTKKDNWMFGANAFEAGGSTVSLSSPLRSYDFRDPEAVYDAENERFILYISAKDGNDVPVVARYFVSADLSAVAYDGIAYRDTSVRDANMFECADVFAIGNKWYLTYSVQTAGEGADGGNADQAPVGQNGKMHYAVADSPTGTFTRFADSALDSHVFYAGKTVQDGESTFMAGWVRRRAFGNEGWQYDWGGHLSVHELVQYADGSLGTALPAEVRAHYSVERALDDEISDRTVSLLYENKDLYTVSREYSSYLLHATVTFDSSAEEFGFALGYDAELSETVEFALVPRFHKMRSGLRNRREAASKYVRLTPGETYDLVLFTEGSVVTLYVNNSVALSARVSDIGNRNIAVFALGGSVTFTDLHMYTLSEYADTLYTGGALTATDADGARTGAVRQWHVAPESPAVLTYAAENENYVRYTVATSNLTAAQTVTVRYNGKTLVAKQAAAGEIIQLSGSTYAAKGKQITVEIAADADSTAYANVSMETDKKPFAAETVAEVSGESAQFIAGGAGIYEYVATLLYSGDGSGSPVFEAGAQAAAIAANGNLLTLRGAVNLGAGEQLAAGLCYRTFTPDAGTARVVLQVRKGTDTFATGVGTHALPVSKAANLTAEIVPTYDRVEIDYNRDASAYMEFGKEAKAQGIDGFVYAYGRAGDELLPMDTFNANEGFPLHSAPGVSGHLQARDGYLKAGDDYMSAFVWVAPVDAVIDVYTRVKTGDGDAYVQAQLWRNGSLLADRLLHGATDWVAVEAIEVEVKRGDSVALAVGACGKELPENPPAVDFTFEVRGDGIRFDPSAPVIADYAADFTAEANGDYGWKYMTADYGWNPERVNGVTELQKSNHGWGSAGLGIDAQGTATG